MRFLIYNDSAGASVWFKQGIAKALAYSGHDVYFYTPEQSLFDALAQLQPDVLYTNTYSLTEETLRAVKKYPHLKIFLRGNDWGEHLRDVPDWMPIGKVSEQEVRIVEKLRDQGGVQFIFTHYHPNDIELTMGHWTKQLGIPTIALSNSADVFSYSVAHPRAELECDISFLGGYWGYKAVTIKPYVFNLFHPSAKLNGKIFGNSVWPQSQYLGNLREDYVKDLFVSTKVNLNVHEPHSQIFGYDVNERIFKVLCAGGFLVSDYVESIAKNYFPNGEVVMGKTPQEFQELVRYYLENPERCRNIRETGQQTVLHNYTYFHQVQRMFNQIGEPELAQKSITAYTKFLQEIKYV